MSTGEFGGQFERTLKILLCDPVIVLAEVTVLTQGKMEEVRRNREVLDAYLGGGEDE